MEENLQKYLNEMHSALLNMMIDLDKFLRENELDYSIAYGTMLGAVRHKGFIPWDDDLDIFMKRDDYERFIKIYNEKGGIEGYTLYATDDPESWLTHSKLYKNNTAMISKIEDLFSPTTKTTEHKELFIDIVPLDKIPTNKRKKRKFLFNAKLRLVYTRNHPYQAKKSKILWLISKILLSIPKSLKRRILIKTNKHVVKYNYLEEEFNYISTAEPAVLGEIIPPVLNNTIDAEFEGHKFKMYEEYDTILKSSYGDYMQLPKPENRKPVHSGGTMLILDVNKFLAEHVNLKSVDKVVNV